MRFYISADIEGIVFRAVRRSRVHGETGLSKAALEQELAGFLREAVERRHPNGPEKK